jgi:hypothetical protein
MIEDGAKNKDEFGVDRRAAAQLQTNTEHTSKIERVGE